MLQQMNKITKALSDFDKLPTELRDILNYTEECIDPRYIYGMFKEQGLKNTLMYLDSIGIGETMSEKLECNN